MRTPRRPIVIHPSITEDRVVAAAMRRMNSLDNPGFCIFCGAASHDCEPDMEKAKCESCGHNTRYGAEQLVIMNMYHKE